jgi:hypothetical protein
MKQIFADLPHPDALTSLPPCPIQIRAREEERKRQEEVRKEQQRQDKYAAALETEEMRRSSIKARADEKERMLAELYARRKKEHDLRKVEQEFQVSEWATCTCLRGGGRRHGGLGWGHGEGIQPVGENMSQQDGSRTTVLSSHNH